MDTHIDDPKLLTRYLLGELTEDEASRLEERLLIEDTDDELFESLEAAEGELFAAHVRGRLGERERQEVARRLAATPDGRRRLELARGLATLSDEAARVVPFAPRKRSVAAPAWRWAAAAGLAALVAGGAWLAVEREARQRQEVARLAAERGERGERSDQSDRIAALEERLAGERERAAALERQLAESRESLARLERERAEHAAAPQALEVASFALSLATLRGDGGEIERLAVPQSADRVRLEVDLDGPVRHERFRATLRDADGDSVWSATDLAPRRTSWGGVVALEAPARALPPGRYELQLTGLSAAGPEDLGFKEFEVIEP